MVTAIFNVGMLKFDRKYDSDMQEGKLQDNFLLIAIEIKDDGNSVKTNLLKQNIIGNNEEIEKINYIY